MSTVLASIIATFITLPVLAWIVIFFASYRITQHKKRSFQVAVDITTVFFMIACYFLIYEIWHLSMFWMIAIIVLLSGILFSVVLWKVRGDIDTKRLLKGVWRFNFLLFFIGYTVLFVYGLLNRLVQI